MRHIKPSESSVMQEFERIAAEKGWMIQGTAVSPSDGETTQDLTDLRTKESADMAKNIRTAQEPTPEHIPTSLVNPEHQGAAGVQSPTTMGDIDRMLAGVREPADIGTGNLVRDIQRSLAALGSQFRATMATAKVPDGVDGIWGPKTRSAVEQAGLVFGLPNVTNMRLTDSQPGKQALLAVLSDLLNAGKTQAAKPGNASFPAAPEHVPAGLAGESGLAPKASLDAIGELVSLANDLDAMGETRVAEAVDGQIRLYKAALDKLYGITGETGEQLVGKAHPGGGPTMVPAKDEGGKVETVVEEQRKDIDVVKTQPTGKRAAFVARQLVALANRLDAEGKTEAALLVDKTLAELREGSARPFVGDGLRKEAVEPLTMGIGLGVGILLTKLVQSMSHWQENLSEDLGDYLSVLDKLAQDDAKWQPYATGLRSAVEPYRAMFQRPPSGDAKARQTYRVRLQEFGDKILPQMERITQSIPRGWWTVGFGKGFRIRDKFDDVKESYGEILSILDKADELAATPTAAPSASTAPAANKEEPAYEQQLRAAIHLSYAKFKGTVDTLLRGLTRALQDPASEAEANRMLKGKLNETIDWLRSLRGRKEPTTLAERNTLNGYNRILWDGYLEPLRRNPKLVDVFASSKGARMVRKAAPPKATAPTTGIPGAPIGPLGESKTPAPALAVPVAGTKPGKPGVRRGPAKKSRPELQRLQQMMISLNLPLGKRQADGVWGPYTANAWNMLDHMAGGRLGAAPSEKGAGPTPTQIDTATRLANVLARRQAVVEIAPGVSLPTSAFASPQAFLRALAARRAAGIDTGGSLDTAANRKRALELLRGFAGRMEDEDVQLGLAASLGAQEAQRLPQQVNALLDALGAAETGIPSYRRPEGAPGYGRAPRGEGAGTAPFGTLEGGSGRGPSGIGRGSRPEPEMSVTDQVYTLAGENIPVNDAQQALFWAYDFWRRHHGEMARAGSGVGGAQSQDYYVVARAVVRFMRIRIAQLGGTAEVRRNPDLQIELRRLYEDVTAMEQLLKGS